MLPTYATPEALDDGWSTADPAELGLSADRLRRMSGAIRSGDYPNVHAVPIAKDGRLVFEEYFEGHDLRYRLDDRRPVSLVFDRDTLHDVRSVTKSLTSALVGISLAERAISSLDTALVDFFPEHGSAVTLDKRRITLHHALSMTAGLEWNEGDSRRVVMDGSWQNSVATLPAHY